MENSTKVKISGQKLTSSVISELFFPRNAEFMLSEKLLLRLELRGASFDFPLWTSLTLGDEDEFPPIFVAV